MKKLLFTSGIVLLIAVSCTSEKIQETESGSFLYNFEPMPMDTANSIQYKWDHKEIFETLKLDGAETFENWELSFGSRENVGEISLQNRHV